jgi:hypothetical protein
MLLTNLIGIIMNKLLLNCRPGTVFDANNKEHRNAYHSFITNSSWGRSPYQFILEPGFEDVPTMCRHRLCEYYVNREFAGRRNTKRVNKNAKLTVVKLKPKND